jgi:hypothetical protein
MNYFRLYRKDGTLKVICSLCRSTVGIAGDSSTAAEIEARHRCCAGARSESRVVNIARYQFATNATSSVILSGDCEKHSDPRTPANIILTLLSAAFFLYAVPTSLEFLAAQYFNPWLACILLGDLVGCVWLISIFKMRKTGLLLYVVLATLKTCMCVTQFIPSTTLFWITDAIPAVVIVSMIARAGRGLPQAFPR